MLPCLVNFRLQLRHASQLCGLFPFSPYILTALLPSFPFPSSRDEEPVTATPLHSVLTPYCFKSFSCNTYGSLRKCCKQKTYRLAKPFSCNTYKKQVSVMVNQVSDNDHRPERPCGAKIDLSRQCRATNHESPVTSPLVAAFPSECYDLVFHDPC